MKSVEIRIRPAVKADFPALRLILAQSDQLHYELDPERFLPVSEFEYSDGLLEATCFREAGAYFVAECDGAVAGLMEIVIEYADAVPSLRHQSSVYISDLAVDEKYRRQGIAKALFDEAFSWARDQGLQHVTLAVNVHNDVARNLYAGLGFRIIGHTMAMDL